MKMMQAVEQEWEMLNLVRTRNRSDFRIEADHSTICEIKVQMAPDGHEQSDGTDHGSYRGFDLLQVHSVKGWRLVDKRSN